ncbi:hypothetical protein [Streptomyces sp. NPDC048277]|uniref:hypothetical protein n=1 Tax=Streptomyces sp. NPDC048277 TaxID=3155027 RepID=UPI0034007471
MPADARSPKKPRDNRAALTHLRGGRRFISHLDTGNCYGIGISPDILTAAKKPLVERRVQDKPPHLTITGEDWERRPHGRSKMRVSRSPLPTV